MLSTIKRIHTTMIAYDLWFAVLSLLGSVSSWYLVKLAMIHHSAGLAAILVLIGSLFFAFAMYIIDNFIVNTFSPPNQERTEKNE